MKIAVTGARGLIGSRIIELLSDTYDFLPLTSADIDIRNEPTIAPALSEKNIDAVLHLAAKTDVDGSEAEKGLGEESEAWKTNVIGTRNVARYCKENSIKLIYISTDFVFDGKKVEGESYTEDDKPNPINFYAKTKYEGEKAVQESGARYSIMRIAYPYRAEFDQKKDFVRTILARLKDGQTVSAVTDHIMCPTFIDDIALVMDELISTESEGIFHTVGNMPISPYDAACLIAKRGKLDVSLIQPTTRAEYFKDKAPRPFNLYLKNGRIENLKTKMRSFEDGLAEILI